MDGILNEIKAERQRQIEKWGIQYLCPEKFLVILGEEYGEACRAVMRGDSKNLRKELIQVAAVAVQMLEMGDKSPAVRFDDDAIQGDGR